MKIRIIKKTHCYRPTFLGMVIFLILLLIIIRLSLPGFHSFLHKEKPVESKNMVLEGWVSTYALPDFIKFYKDNGYKNLIVTGIPMTQYEYASDFNYTSQATIQALKHYGFTDTIYEAAIPQNVYQDRTYSTAIIARSIIDQHPEWSKSFNIYSMGVHSRRTLLLFEKAFGKNYNIGIISHSDRTYIGNMWWRSSVGFRTVSNEVLAFFYAKFIFNPKKTEYMNRIEEGLFFDKHRIARAKKEFEFTDSLNSPFTKEEIQHHKGFNYFDIDETYKITAKFTVDTSNLPFEMPTTTERKPVYRIYGYLDFTIKDTLLKLTAYQNMDYISHPDYGTYLFVPFTDLTNGISTYGGGRYLDIDIPKSNICELDFNSAYNPYCAYSKRWSCPLVPFENHLNINVLAGEKKYKKE